MWGRHVWTNGGIPPKGNGLDPYSRAEGEMCSAQYIYSSSNSPLLMYANIITVWHFNIMCSCHQNLKFKPTSHFVSSANFCMFTAACSAYVLNVRIIGQLKRRAWSSILLSDPERMKKYKIKQKTLRRVFLHTDPGKV